MIWIFNMILGMKMEYSIIMDLVGIEYQYSMEFDGNGKVIKNLKASGGLIGSVVVDRDCKFVSCGVHDLTVQDSEYIWWFRNNKCFELF